MVKKKHLSKTIALCLCLVMLSTVMIIPASAATEYTWGPHYWTPEKGSFRASTTIASAYGLQWTSDQIAIIKRDQAMTNYWHYGTEFEFRPIDSNGNSINPHSIWSAETSFSTNLPAAYYEFQDDDPDDIAVCNRFDAAITPNATYYAHLYLKPVSGASNSTRYIFESEYGMSFVGLTDALPTSYEQYTLSATYFGNIYHWG